VPSTGGGKEVMALKGYVLWASGAEREVRVRISKTPSPRIRSEADQKEEEELGVPLVG